MRAATSLKMTARGSSLPREQHPPCPASEPASRYLENSTAWFQGRNHTPAPKAHLIKSSCWKPLICPQQEKLSVIFKNGKKKSQWIPWPCERGGNVTYSTLFFPSFLKGKNFVKDFKAIVDATQWPFYLKFRVTKGHFQGGPESSQQTLKKSYLGLPWWYSG